MKKLPYFIIAILVIALIVLGIVCLIHQANRRDQQKITDQIFLNNFSQLCNNLNMVADDENEWQELNKENQKYAHTCFSMLSITSYAGDIKFGKIILALVNMSEAETLYVTINKETATALKDLSYRISSGDMTLVDSVYETLLQTHTDSNS